EPFAAWPRLIPRSPQPRTKSPRGRLGGCHQMSRYKVAAGLAALALSAAVVTALAGSRPDVGADAVPQVTADVAPEMKPNPAAEAKGDVAPELTPDVAPAAAKGDRLALRVLKPDARSAGPDVRSAKPDP